MALGKLARSRRGREDHPDSWIFGPKRSVHDLTENRPPLVRLWLIAAGVLVASAVSAVALVDSPEGDDVAEAGVPEGTELTPSTSVRVDEDGTVVDALDVTGNIYVTADNVTIRRTRVSTAGAHAIRVGKDSTGLVVEDSTLDCTTDRGRSGIAWSRYTATRVEVGGDCSRGFVHNQPVTITDSYWRGEPFPDVQATAVSGISEAPPASETPVVPATPAPPPSVATPPPAPAPTTTVPATQVAAPPTGDFPTAATTGVPGGTQLNPAGGMVVTEPGKVIDGLDINGMVTVKAQDVTIRNSRITTASQMGVKIENGSLLIEDSEIVGTSNDCSQAIGYGHYLARRIDVSGCQDGLKASGGSVEVYDSYIHGLRQTADSHNDGIQSTGGTHLVYEGNTICALHQSSVSAIKLTPEAGPINDVTIRGNFVYGGNYTIYMDSKPGTYGLVTNAVVEGNVFDPSSYKWGQWAVDDHPTQRLVNNTETVAAAIFGSNPCAGG
jgi:hypothetical protein